MTMNVLYGNHNAQKFGLSYIPWLTGDDMAKHSITRMTEVTKRQSYLLKCLPCRYTSLRICYDNPRLEWMINTFRLAVEKVTRLRITTNLGKFSTDILKY